MKPHDTEFEQSPQPDAFDSDLIHYRRRLGAVLTESRWAFWRGSFWTRGHWRRQDPELQKILDRLFTAVDELLRRHHLDPNLIRDDHGHAPAAGVPEVHCRRIAHLLETDPADLTLDLAIEVFDTLDRILIEIGDARLVCELIQSDLQWHRGSTTWITWDAMKFEPTPPTALATYQAGARVPDAQLAAARNQLAGFHRTRSTAYQAHRARQKARARNLHVLAVVLVPLVIGVAWLLAAFGGTAVIGYGGVALVATAGALGSAVSGTIKARDNLIRSSDIRGFRSGLVAQVLLGAAAALFVLLVLTSGLLKMAGTDSLEGLAAIGFLAGFSEPFFLKTVESISKLGEEKPKEEDRTQETSTS